MTHPIRGAHGRMIEVESVFAASVSAIGTSCDTWRQLSHAVTYARAPVHVMGELRDGDGPGLFGLVVSLLSTPVDPIGEDDMGSHLVIVIYAQAANEPLLSTLTRAVRELTWNDLAANHRGP